MRQSSRTLLALRNGHQALTTVLVLAIAVACALLLALPGQTVTTKYVPDLFIHLDGAYRVVSGQAPNRDFHTPLGPLAYYLPAVGYWLSGALGGAMPTGMALLLIALVPAIAHIVGSRLRPAIAVPLAAFLILILAVPINLGEGVMALSFAKFHNRIGWAALAALLVMYLRPEQPRPRQDWWDALSAALLTLVMIATKITYGLVALCFLIFLLLDVRQRRWVGLALALVLAAGLLIEALWRGSMAYLSDLLLTARVSGGLRGTWGQIIDHVLGNMADYVLLSLFAGLALRRARSLRDALFYLFCAVSGFLVINQNFQAWGVITIHAAAAVAAETVLRFLDEAPEAMGRNWSVTAGVKLLFLALVLPTIVHCTIALGLHAAAASLRWGEPVALAPFDRVRLVNLWTWSDHEAAVKYLTAVQDGAAALSGLDPKPSRIVVLDLANPFSAGLGVEPARGDSSWLLWGRTIDGTNFVPADRLLADVQVVMQPKPPQDPAASATEPKEGGGEALQTLYGPYIAAHFEPLRQTEHWIVYRRRELGAQTTCSGALISAQEKNAALQTSEP